jgi:hypothetical protein
MVWVCLPIAVLLAFLMRKRKLRRKRKLVVAPLAGYDTGVRSPWRVPVRFFKPHRGF